MLARARRTSDDIGLQQRLRAPEGLHLLRGVSQNESEGGHLPQRAEDMDRCDLQQAPAAAGDHERRGQLVPAPAEMGGDFVQGAGDEGFVDGAENRAAQPDEPVGLGALQSGRRLNRRLQQLPGALVVKDDAPFRAADQDPLGQFGQGHGKNIFLFLDSGARFGYALLHGAVKRLEGVGGGVDGGRELLYIAAAFDVDAVPRVHAVHDAGFFGDLADREDVQPEHPLDGQARPGDQKERAADDIDAVRMDQAYQDFALGGGEVQPEQNGKAPDHTDDKQDAHQDKQPEAVMLRQPRTFEQLFHLGHEIRVREGLGDVGVGPEVQTLGHMGLAAQGGQQHDADVLPIRVFAHPLAHLETVHDRQHDVQKDQVRMVLGDRLHRLFAAESHDGFIAVLLHQELQRHDEAGLVIHDEDLLGHGLPRDRP